MAYKYDDPVHIDFDRDVAFCWLRDEGGNGSPVRIEVSREYMEDHWHVGWRDERVVRKEFIKRRRDYVDAASRLPDVGKNYRVYPIWRMTS